tara:strand:- start:48505 stop:48840 length:336 start_codon:yes stop_codon:yes gene_type:complete
MKKYKTSKVISLLLGMVLLGVLVVRIMSISNPKLSSDIFVVGNGYGYKIAYKDRILIKQDFIPAVHGENPFRNQKEAKLVAQLVKNRLLKGESPVVSLKDLANLNIAILNN